MSSAPSPRRDQSDSRIEAGPEFGFLVNFTSASCPVHLQHTIDWEELVRLARHHGVFPQLSIAVSRNGTQVPHEIKSKILHEDQSNTRHSLWLTREMFRILDQLKARNVDALPYKGPVLAQQLYGSVAARQFNDIDILIRARDVPVAVAALHELGYEPGIELTPRQERAYLKSGYEYTFDGSLGRNLVELQWNLLPRFYAVDVNTDSLFERAQVLSISGQEVRTFALEDLLIVLCLHAAKHSWVQLSWLCDIRELTASRAIDWAQVNAQARELGIQRIMTLTFLLCERLWGTEFPSALERDFSENSEPTLCGLMKTLSEGEEPDSESLSYFRLMWDARERKRDRMRFLWRLATTPSVGEWSAIPLPSALFPLYRGIRMFRLARRVLTS